MQVRCIEGRPTSEKMGSMARSLLSQTRPFDLCDSQGRLLCFAGTDNLKEWTLTRCLTALESVVPGIRGNILGNLMNHARPDDVFRWVSPLQIVDDWPLAEHDVQRLRRWELWSLIVRRLKGFYFGLQWRPEEWPPSRRDLGAASERSLALALLETWKLEQAGNLVLAWLELDCGADLEKALRRAQSSVPDFSVFGLVEIAIGLDFEPLKGAMGLDDAAIARWSARRDHLAERLLDLVLGPLVVLH